MGEIVSWRPEFRADFERLNREWIERWFGLERSGPGGLPRPGRAISSRPAGRSFSWWTRCSGARHLRRRPAGRPTASSWRRWRWIRRRGAGVTATCLMQAAIDFAREAGGRRLTLVSNTKLGPAIRLYRKHGFVEVPSARGQRVRAGGHRDAAASGVALSSFGRRPPVPPAAPRCCCPPTRSSPRSP